ncbi:hypothetical protein GDO81_010434 [Engystomops pustulosus]|uniref:Uncharacterized protein n=1 Tax=Engystomops pustulosus TaxID=76066 RepID=A0AAV7C0P4_ENGPU|nr:hypothetical protein GDO81_010434 [Engystomops pustulosus]
MTALLLTVPRSQGDYSSHIQICYLVAPPFPAHCGTSRPVVLLIGHVGANHAAVQGAAVNTQVYPLPGTRHCLGMQYTALKDTAPGMCLLQARANNGLHRPASHRLHTSNHTLTRGRGSTTRILHGHEPYDIQQAGDHAA